MKLASLATLAAFVGYVSAVAVPSGVPATSGPAFTSLSFDTTAYPSSYLSALSSLISSESTAITPYLPTITMDSGSSAASQTESASPSSTTPVAASSPTASTPSPTSTSTSGAHNWRDVQSGVIAGVALGVIAALV